MGRWDDVKNECLKSFYQPVLLLYELEDSSEDHKDDKNYNNDNNNNNNNNNNNDSKNDNNNRSYDFNKDNKNYYNNSNYKKGDADKSNSNHNSKYEDLINFNPIEGDREKSDENTSTQMKVASSIDMKNLMDLENEPNGSELHPSISIFPSSSSSLPSFTYPTIPLINDFNTFFGITNSVREDSTDSYSVHPSTDDSIICKNILEDPELSSKTAFSLKNDNSSDFKNSSYSGELLSIVMYESQPIITSVTLYLHDQSVSDITSVRNTTPDGRRSSDMSISLHNPKSRTSTLPQHQSSLQSQTNPLSQEQVRHDSKKNSTSVRNKQKKFLGIQHDVNEKGHIIITNFITHPLTGMDMVISAASHNFFLFSSLPISYDDIKK